MSESPFQVGQKLRCIRAEHIFSGIQIGAIVTVLAMHYSGSRWFFETEEFFGWCEVSRFEPV
jgi:hypothetical protein